MISRKIVEKALVRLAASLSLYHRPVEWNKWLDCNCIESTMSLSKAQALLNPSLSTIMFSRRPHPKTSVQAGTWTSWHMTSQARRSLGNAHANKATSPTMSRSRVSLSSTPMFTKLDHKGSPLWPKGYLQSLQSSVKSHVHANIIPSKTMLLIQGHLDETSLACLHLHGLPAWV